MMKDTSSKAIALINSVTHWWAIPSLLLVVVMLLIPGVTKAAEPGSAAGIYPTRVVIPKNQKSGAITLTNTASVEVSYRMTLIEMGLDSHGRFRQLAVNELPVRHKSSKLIVRFSPRQVRLRPGQSQVVRVIVRRGAIATPGEYRSHLVLQALPVLSERLNENIGSDSVVVNASSGVNVGVSIPIIVRHGDTNAIVTTNSVTLNQDSSGAIKSVSLAMGLRGDRSAYGDFSVYLVNGKKEKQVGVLKSWALYYPYPAETVRIPINVQAGEVTPDSKIRVIFSNRSIDSAVTNWVDETLVPVVR